jgi:hypothetical protein
MGSISDEVILKIYLILPAALGPEAHSASNRNEYQKQKNNSASVEYIDAEHNAIQHRPT